MSKRKIEKVLAEPSLSVEDEIVEEQNTSDKEDGEPEPKTTPKYDFFVERFEECVKTSAAQLKLPKKTRTIRKHDLPGLGRITELAGSHPQKIPLTHKISPSEAGWVPKIAESYEKVMANRLGEGESTTEQEEMMNMMLRYVDVLSIPPQSSLHRVSYCAHVMNHVVRSRDEVLKNNTTAEDALLNEDALDSLRDQGFVRPSVLIVVPFRKDAYEIIKIMGELVLGGKDRKTALHLGNRKKFEEEFGDNGYRVAPARLVGQDYRDLLEGNVDDCFSLGISLANKEFRLYAEYEKSDILLFSPLGLRMMLNGDVGADSQIISSLEIVVLDKCDVMMQQNWEHLLLSYRFLNIAPRKIENDIRRVRQCYLDGYSQLYCQSLVFSSFSHELVTSLVMSNMHNHRGLFIHNPASEGCLEKVCVPICQELHRINVTSAENAADARFEYFKDKILPSLTLHTVVFIPSYYDFVRVRNYLKKSIESFAQCHEYAEDKKVARARTLFHKGEKKLLLLTERFHYFKRYHIRGIENIVFYQAPNQPDFYSEVINFSNPPDDSPRVKSVLAFSQFDKCRLSNIFGAKMTNGILKSDKKVQAIVSD